MREASVRRMEVEDRRARLVWAEGGRFAEAARITAIMVAEAGDSPVGAEAAEEPVPAVAVFGGGLETELPRPR